MIETTSLNDCSLVTLDCFVSTTDLLLGWETEVIDDGQSANLENAISAQIPIETDSLSFEITILVDSGEAEILAREMLMCDEDEPLPDDTRVEDSVGELCNLVAGTVKKQIHAEGHVVKIGCPEILCENLQDVLGKKFEHVWQLKSGPIFPQLLVN